MAAAERNCRSLALIASQEKWAQAQVVIRLLKTNYLRMHREHAHASSPELLAAELPPDDMEWLGSDEQGRSIVGDVREVFGRELWLSRGLLYELTRRDLRIRYKQAALGFAWAVLMPTLIVIAGALVRFAMAFVGGRAPGAAEIAGMAVKAVPWSFFVGALGFATASLTGNSNLVTKIYFPREVLPLAAVCAQSFDSTIGALTLLVIFPAVGIRYGWAILWAPLLAACVFIFTAGTGLLVSCANLFFRDVKYLVHVLLSFGIFFTPVFFEPEMFGPRGARLMMLNPLAPLLEGLRLSVVYNRNLLDSIVAVGRKGSIVVWSPLDLAYSAAWAVVVLVAGVVLFHRAEVRFAEYV
jgi:ABC-type polysaccharide/polyol phosphate export permease